MFALEIRTVDRKLMFSNVIKKQIVEYNLCKLMKKNKTEWFKPALFTLQNHSVCTFTAGYTFPNLIAPFFPAGIADNRFYV